MKIEQVWIICADRALRSEILQQSDDGLLKYSSVYKGYISSYGASIVQSGLIPASAFFEKTDSNADEPRCAVVRAVIYILSKHDDVPEDILCGLDKLFNQYIFSKHDEVPENTALLSVYALQPGIDQRKLVKSVDKAIAALKIAIRQYRGIKDKIKKERLNTRQTTDSSGGLSITISEAEFLHKYGCNSDNEQANIGWLYYRDYYRNFAHSSVNVVMSINKKGKETLIKKGSDLELTYKKKNEYICRSSLASLSEYNKSLLNSLPCNTRLSFKTTYPGLLIGSGLSHGTGTDNDMKIGFLFDYTTGLPYIPGSSVKGILRSMFPLVKVKKDLSDEEKIYNKRRIKYIQQKLQGEYSDEQIIMLTRAIFEDPYDKNNDKLIKRDVFMDALIDPEQEDKYFMGDDFITTHRDPLKNPTPLQFLKVLPEVVFCFSFNLYNTCLGDIVFDINQKKELFKSILADVGVGAKTNVGYGQLEIVE